MATTFGVLFFYNKIGGYMKNRMVLLMGKHEVTLENTELDTRLKDDELLVKVDACNICTSEYGIYSGARNANFPYTIGHEWAGHVVEIGPKVTRFDIGDQVTGCYEFDAKSKEALVGNSSSAPRTYSFNERNSNGFYGRFRACADYIVIPEITAFKMNPSLNPSEAGFLEPLATVVSGIRKMNLKVTDRVLVVGGGTMGILNALVVRSHGCSVVVSEIMDKKIAVLKKAGLQTVKVNATSPKEQVREIQQQTGVNDFDKVIIAVGHTSAYEQAFQALKQYDGVALLFAAGFPSPKLSISANDIHYRKMTIIGTYTANYQDFLDASLLLNEGKVDVSALIEKYVSIEKIKEAMEYATIPGAFRISVVGNKTNDNN